MERRLIRLIAIVLVAAACSLPCLGAPAQAVQDLLDKAAAAEKANDLPGAVELYQQTLKLEPDNLQALSQGGWAAYRAHKYELAIPWLKQYHKLQPNDYRALSRLIMAAQMGGNPTEADAAIADMRALWKSGKDPELSKQPGFVRDIFKANNEPVVVFERFNPDMSKNAHIWDFMLLGPDNKPKIVYYVEFDPGATELLRAQGNKNAAAYFFDSDDARGHTTYTQIDHRPTYPEARATMQKIIEGKVQPASHSTKPTP